MGTLAALGCERMFINSPLTQEHHYRQALERVQRRWGEVNTVINLADQPCLGLFETSTDADWQWTLEHNLLAVAHGCKAAISAMKRQHSGQLLNITTQTARLPHPGLALTSALQGAVVALTESMQAELAPLGIQVQLACVDFFDGLVPAPPRALTPLDEARFERASNTSLNIDEVAGEIIRGLKRKDFLILTHKSGRNAWRRYRLRYAAWLASGRELARKLRPEQRFLKHK
nr:hypothetical protein MERC5_00015 [uncultured bacterium]